MSSRADQISATDIDWTNFDRLFRPASAEAAGIVERLLAGEEVPAPETADVASQVNLRLRQRALIQASPPAAVAYLHRLSSRFLDGTDGLDSAEEARVTKVLLGVDQLIREASAQEAMAPDTALDVLGRARRLLEGAGQPASRRKRIDAEDYAALIEAAWGRAYAAGGRHDEAEVAFWTIVELRDRSTVTADQLFPAIIAYVDRFGRRNPDRALTRLIPLVRHRLGDLGTCERVALLMTLADLYQGIGDVEAARQVARDTAAALAEAGLPTPETAKPQVLLDAVTALSVTPLGIGQPTRVERHRRFMSIALALLKRASILRLEGADRAAGHDAVMEWLPELMDIAANRISQMGGVPDPDLDRGPGQAPRGLSDAHPMFRPRDPGPVREFAALDARADLEGASEPLATELEALAAAARLQPALAARALTLAAEMRAELGNAPRAVTGYLAAAERARAADDLTQEIHAVLGLALMPDPVRDQRTKRADLRPLIDRIEDRRAKLNAAYLPSAFMSDKVMPYGLAMHYAGQAGDDTERLRLMERLRAFEIHGPPLAGPATDTLRCEVAALSDRLRAERDPSVAARLRVERRLAWDELMIARPRARPDFDLDALRARLGGTAVLSLYYMAPGVLDITLVTARELIRTRRLLGEFPDFGACLAAATEPTKLNRELPGQLERLAEILLPAEMRPALEAASEIVIAPHRDLHGLPWTALPLGGHPLILGRPVATVPNLTVLTRPAGGDRPGPGFFGIGARKTTVTLDGGSPLIDLARAEAQTSGAAAHFPGAASLVGDAATRAAFLTDPRLRAAGIVFFALHGRDVADASLARAPMEAWLAFPDGIIDGIDLACLPLSAQLVVATACFSGRRATRLEGVETLPADALYGLQSAFLLAGAESVLGTLWQADDTAAALITEHLFEALAGGARPAEALHRAVRAYLATPGLKRYQRSPYVWAPYCLTAFSPAVLTLNDSGAT